MENPLALKLQYLNFNTQTLFFYGFPKEELMRIPHKDPAGIRIGIRSIPSLLLSSVFSAAIYCAYLQSTATFYFALKIEIAVD